MRGSSRMTRTPLGMMVGWLALTAALVSLGCASKEQVAGGPPAGPPARVEAPPGKDDGGSPPKQETAPPVLTAPNRREATSPSVKAPRGPDAPAPSPSKPAATPALDLKSLEKRLRETTAIGVFTKLSLKNQVDDLLDQFRAFHQGKGGSKLSELRQSYDLLIMKVLSLLQDSDPPLARDIVTSREAIWGLLADPAKFATLS